MRSQPHYIRTIKPNQNRSPSEYDTKAILHQIKYLGLQENIRVRRAGFAYRNTFEKMVERSVPLFLLVARPLADASRCTDSTSSRPQHRTLATTSGKAMRGRAASRS